MLWEAPGKGGERDRAVSEREKPKEWMQSTRKRSSSSLTKAGNRLCHWNYQKEQMEYFSWKRMNWWMTRRKAYLVLPKEKCPWNSIQNKTRGDTQPEHKLHWLSASQPEKEPGTEHKTPLLLLWDRHIHLGSSLCPRGPEIAVGTTLGPEAGPPCCWALDGARTKEHHNLHPEFPKRGACSKPCLL